MGTFRRRGTGTGLLVAGLAAALAAAGAAPVRGAAQASAVVVYRVNAGGPALTGTPAWSADTSGSPSAYVNAAATGNTTYSTTSAIAMTDPSIPAGTPAALFQSERWDPAAAPELQWSFPVTAGSYEVRLYFAEIYAGAQTVGARLFNVAIEGKPVLTNFDVYAAVGANKGLMKSFQVTSNSTLTIDFTHVKENPAIKGIEILQSVSANRLGASPAAVDFGGVDLNTTSTKSLQLTNLGSTGDPPVTIGSTSIAGADAAQFGDSFNDASPVTLAPGASTTINVTFKPASTGSKSATLNVAHSGTNSPLAVPLTGSGGSTPVGFGKSALAGTSLSSPTSLQFGPDGRLYVAQQNGLIVAYKLARTGPNSYAVTATETIAQIQSIPNHNDDGTLNTGVTTRQVTGLVVGGTAANPVVYVSSSDPRIGAGSSGQDTGLDTSSGIVSRLTWNGSSWQKLDLVRGLPRSEENHSTNGLQLDAAANALYVAQGGNTNQGAPSNNFAFLPEYALSGAILKIDLNAIGSTTYDLPTLDDDTRPGSADAGDPFGGNDGKNQTKLVAAGPVQVYAPGFRNPYDVLLTKSGRLYTIDNGSNAGWGDVPINEGPAGNCTNQIHEPGTTDPDALHLIGAQGYYGGHPNPTRGNTANTFDSPPQSPVGTANPVECDYRAPAVNGSITTFSASTDGLAEYTASNFGGAMKGDLVATSFDNSVYRVKLTSSGGGLVLKAALFTTVGSDPLDVTAQGDGGPFPGTIWVANHGSGAIDVFEPNDFGGSGATCTGADSTTLDEDGDGNTNADEIDNGTNPCSAADVPPDWDGDKVSNLNDPDDDNDGQPDTSDPFAIDPRNGTATTLPVRYTWDNDAPPAGGLLNLGFSGLMTNRSSNYASLFSAANMTAGGAAGVTTIDKVPEGDAFQATNTQQYAFQLGIKAPAGGTFTAHSRIVSPFGGLTPQNNQSMGLFAGNGDQDNYVKLVTSANGGAGGIWFLKEVAAATTTRPQAAVAMPGPNAVDLYLTVDPVAATVQPAYAVTTGGVTGARVNLGAPEPIPASWLTGATSGLAVGIISTSSGPAPEFPATWDLIEVTSDSATPAGLVAAYNFDEGSGPTLVDRSGNGNTGTVANTTWSTAGKYGGALSFDGTSSWVTVADSSSLDLTGALTLEAWVNPAALGTTWRTVLFKEQSAGMVYSLYANESTGHPIGQVNIGGEQNAVGSAGLPIDAWTHLAVTYDGQTLKLYVNGALAGSKAQTDIVPASSGVLRMGGNGIWPEWFSGRIDNVRIYNRALTQAEIQADLASAV